jgi:hypothetical protein
MYQPFSTQGLIWKVDSLALSRSESLLSIKFQLSHLMEPYPNHLIQSRSPYYSQLLSLVS